MIRAVFAAVALVAATPGVAAPIDGTWKLDATTLDASNKPFVFALTQGTYSCTTCATPYSVKADGAFHPVAGDPYRDEVAIHVDSPRALTLTARKGGRTVLVETMTVAADDATITFAFNDTTAANGVPVIGKQVARRTAPGPAGSHATSGAWLTSGFSANDAGTRFTFASSGDAITFTSPTGQRYTATVGGPRAAVVGDPGWDGVTLARSGPDALVETDYRGDTRIAITTYVVAPDGRTLRSTNNDLLRGATMSATMVRQ